MKWSEVQSGIINGATSRLWHALGDDASLVAQRINTDPEFVRRVVEFVVVGGYYPSVDQTVAGRVMGSNFYGIEGVARLLGFNPFGEDDLRRMEKIPFSISTLESCRKTHALIALSPIPIVALKSRMRTRFAGDNSWYDTSSFVYREGKLGWMLARKGLQGDSGVQDGLLSSRELVYAALVDRRIWDQEEGRDKWFISSCQLGVRSILVGISDEGIKIRVDSDDNPVAPSRSYGVIDVA